VVEKERKWAMERQFLQEQISFAQKQTEENKKMHESLLSAINTKLQEK
jgi:hypothetical protein